MDGAGEPGNAQLYRELLKLDPVSGVFVALAEELCAKGEWEEAAEVCVKGLDHHPDHLRAHVLLGWALWEMGHLAEAEEELRRAADALRRNGIAFRVLSEIAKDSGQSAEAAHFRKVYEVLYDAPEVSETGLDLGADIAADLDAEIAAAFREQVAAEPLTPKRFLTLLQQRFEGRKVKSPGELVVFSEEDKILFKDIIAISFMQE